MTRKWIVATAVLATCGAGAATAAVARDGNPAPLDRAAENDLTVRVTARSSKAAGTTKFLYPQTEPTVIPDSDNASSNFTIKACPAGTRAINGQFETSHPSIVLEASHVAGKRRWSFRLTDLDTDPASPWAGDYTARFGLVCAGSG